MSELSQRNLSGGELSPEHYAKVDQVKYQTGLRTLRNVLIKKGGGTQNRPGSVFIDEVSDSTDTAHRLIPYEYVSGSTEQEYMLLFGDGYVRFIKNGSFITDLDLTITGITKASPAVVTYTGTDPSNGDEVTISGVAGMTELNGRNFKIANVNAGANTFQLKAMDGTTNINSIAYGTYTSGGTASRIYTLLMIHPYAAADLAQLQYSQKDNTLILTRQGYEIQYLRRVTDTNWATEELTLGPTTPSPTGFTVSGAGATYAVTAIDDVTGEESIAATTDGNAPSSGLGATAQWDDVTGARFYRLYRDLGTGLGYGLILDNLVVSFAIIGNVASWVEDYTVTPPYTAAEDPFDVENPAVVGHSQQRRIFANTASYPNKVWATHLGSYANLNRVFPITNAGRVIFEASGRNVGQVRHVLDLDKMVLLTSKGEWLVNGDDSLGGVITPTAQNPKQVTYNGCSYVAPVVIDNNALYLQDARNVVRDLGFSWESSGYRGTDLTIFSTHLFEGKTIDDWAYQKLPNSIVWCVRSDGALLGLTYVREHQIWGWHRHDTDGDVKNVACIKEGNEYAVYAIVARTIGGVTKQYVERFASRYFTAIEDAIFMDSALSYDGWNTGITTMTISTATTYVDGELLTVTKSGSSFFSASDVGNEVHLIIAGVKVRIQITEYVSGTVVKGYSQTGDIPVSHRAVAGTEWARAVDEFTGLWHLEGKEVSVLGDGFVESSPNNPDYADAILTVSGGSVTTRQCYATCHIGLPYLSDIETLDVDTVDGETLSGKMIKTDGVDLQVQNSRGIWAGPVAPSDDDDDPAEGLYELKVRESESPENPVDLSTGKVEIIVRAEWNQTGRIFLRQFDPLPMEILAIHPSGQYPIRRKYG